MRRMLHLVLVLVLASLVVPPLTTYALSWPLVTRGQSGANVTTVQHLLTARGFPVAADGAFGPATEDAVKRFQASRGLTQDGDVGPNTWSALIVTVNSGDNGSAVKAAQVQLNKYGYGLGVDGDFGPATDGATRDFQSKHGLAIDGDIGPNIWSALTSGTSGGGGSGSYRLPLAKSALPRSEYDDPHHDYPAIDLPVPTGTPVYAVTSGTTTRISDSSCGNGYNISGSDGGTYTYCHLSRFVAGSGVRVNPGTLIGYSGNTGNSSGPHLHFGVRTGSTRRCPQRLLLAIYDGAAVPSPASLPTSGCSY